MTNITPEILEDIAEQHIAEDAYLDAMDFLEENVQKDEAYLDDEDYRSGWNMSRAEVLGFENYDACYSTFDENDYEYLQSTY